MIKIEKYRKNILCANTLSIIVLFLLVGQFIFGTTKIISIISVVLVSVYASYLGDYIRRKEIKRRSAEHKKHRLGEYWVITWVLVAVVMVHLSEKYPNLTLPLQEICIILPFVFLQYRSSRKDKREYEQKYVKRGGIGQ